jgi:hypothetical protein
MRKKTNCAPLSFFDQACEGGSPGGCNGLGVVFDFGNGRPQDEVRARELHGQACEGGYPRASNNSGSMFLEGRGGPQDQGRARELFGQACKGGYVESCHRAGAMFYNGQGGPQDFVHARELYGLVCKGGNSEGCNVYGFMHWKGEGGPQYLVRARDLLDEACKSGNASGCFIAGRMARSGAGGPKNKALAWELFGLACKEGFSQGCIELASSGFGRDKPREQRESLSRPVTRELRPAALGWVRCFGLGEAGRRTKRGPRRSGSSPVKEVISSPAYRFQNTSNRAWCGPVAFILGLESSGQAALRAISPVGRSETSASMKLRVCSTFDCGHHDGPGRHRISSLTCQKRTLSLGRNPKITMAVARSGRLEVSQR